MMRIAYYVLRMACLIWMVMVGVACQSAGSAGTQPTANNVPSVPVQGATGGQSTSAQPKGPVGGAPQPRETAPPAPTTGPSPFPAGSGVVFADANGLWVVEEGKAPRQIAQDKDITHPSIAPTKTWVVYTRPAGDKAELWAVAWSGGTPKRILSEADVAKAASSGQRVTWDRVRWLPRTATLLFNTQMTPVGGQPQPHDDLWSVDVETGVIKTLLAAGQGGLFVPAFEGDKLAISQASHGQQPGRVVLSKPDGTEAKTMVEFPPATRRQAYPVPVWARDGSGFLIAVEQGDGVDLYRAPLDAPLGEKFGRIEGQPVNLAWSPDRRRVAYSRLAVPSTATPISSENYEVMIAEANGADAQPYARGLFVNWSPDSARFVYQDGAQVYLGTFNQPTRPLGSADKSAWDVRWMTTRALVYMTASEGQAGQSAEIVYRTIAGQPLSILPKAVQPRGVWFDITPYPYPDG